MVQIVIALWRQYNMLGQMSGSHSKREITLTHFIDFYAHNHTSLCERAKCLDQLHLLL